MKAHFPARPTLCAADAALVHDLHIISCRHARTRDAERRPGLHGNGRAPGEAGQALPLVVETGLLQTQTPPACAGLSPTLPLHNPTITPFQSVVPRATPARGRGRQEESLRAALLLEQAALCLLRVAPPALRKFSFHMVLVFRMFLFLCFFKCLKCFRMGTGATPPRGAHRVRLRPGPAGPGPCDGGCGLSARGSAAPSRAGLGRSWRCRSKMGGRCSTCARAPGRNVRRTAQAAHAPHVEGRTDGCQPAWCS